MSAPAEILLVDDNPADTDLMVEALGQGHRPIRVTTVQDGVAALDYLCPRGEYQDPSRPDLIILDLNLPRKDGRAVLAETRAKAALRRVPIVVFTTSRAEQDVITSYDLGANCYVSKPGRLHDFLSVVSAIGEFWLGIATTAPR